MAYEGQYSARRYGKGSDRTGRPQRILYRAGYDCSASYGPTLAGSLET